MALIPCILTTRLAGVASGGGVSAGLMSSNFTASGLGLGFGLGGSGGGGGGGGTTTTTFKLSISLNGNGTVVTDPAAQNYAPGTVVTLTATPKTGSPWVGWSGACTGTDPTCVLTIKADTSVTAVFSK